MPFQWEKIRTEWLLNQSIGYEPAEIVEAFNTIERIFGAEWFTKVKLRSPGMVIYLVDLGKVLQAIEKLPEAGRIIQGMKDDREAAGDVARLAACMHAYTF